MIFVFTNLLTSFSLSLLDLWLLAMPTHPFNEMFLSKFFLLFPCDFSLSVFWNSVFPVSFFLSVSNI